MQAKWRRPSPATSASSSNRALDARGSSLIALPGGETAKPIFKALAAKKLPWKQVTIIPTDERLVPMDDERSNVRALAQAFLPSGARVIPIAADIPDYRLAGNSADARLQDLPWPPDLVWLGVGEDGHTASMFTGPDLQDALDAPKARRAVGVMPDPLPDNAPVARVTLTRASILSARTVLITLTGGDKREMLEGGSRTARVRSCRSAASSPKPSSQSTFTGRRSYWPSIQD